MNPLTPSNDPNLSRDIEILLCQLLRVVAHQNALAPLGTSPTGADRRHAMDTLAFDLWDLLEWGDFHYSLEHSLRLLLTTPMELYDTKPDSTVFFPVSGIGGYESKVTAACSILAGAESDKSSVLHWATEFKRDKKAHEPQRQLFRALVSGLYQRRALGFPEHFVFGTAHHSTTTLDVFAATWEVPAGGQEPKTSTDKPEIPGSNVPDDGQRGAEGATEGRLDTHIDGKDEGGKSRMQGNEPGDSGKRGQIVIYQLGTFDMRTPFDMLRLCLLMRSTRSLACKYRKEIEDSSLSRIKQQVRDSAWIYDWPSPPRPPPSKTSQKSRTGSGGRKRKLTPVPETSENKMALPLHALGAHELVGVVDVDTPLKLRYVEEMNSKNRVAKYLTETRWEKCEPVPDQMIDWDD